MKTLPEIEARAPRLPMGRRRERGSGSGQIKRDQKMRSKVTKSYMTWNKISQGRRQFFSPMKDSRRSSCALPRHFFSWQGFPRLCIIGLIL
jgi:hypothetical protein